MDAWRAALGKDYPFPIGFLNRDGGGIAQSGCTTTILIPTVMPTTDGSMRGIEVQGGKGQRTTQNIDIDTVLPRHWTRP